MYYTKLLKAYLKGLTGEDQVSDDLEELLDFARRNQITTHPFKVNKPLPRIQSAMGLVRSTYPSSVLDIGTGRGVFLIPLLDEFPQIEVTCIDLLPVHVDFINTLARGGYENLQCFNYNVTRGLPFADGAFDTVTALEVLEHIEELQEALEEIHRLAKRNIVISVPSKEDDNPEHIHLLTKEKFTKLLAPFDFQTIKYDYVHEHMMVYISKK